MERLSLHLQLALALRERLLRESLPPRLCVFTAGGSHATLGVPGEFEVDLTLQPAHVSESDATEISPKYDWYPSLSCTLSALQQVTCEREPLSSVC